MTIRWVIVHLMELPEKSRIKQHYGGEAALYDHTDHLIADVRDGILNLQYFTAIGAMKDIKQGQQKKVINGAPDRPLRPGEKPPEVKMATKEELEMLFPAKAAARRIQRLAQRR